MERSQRGCALLDVTLDSPPEASFSAKPASKASYILGRLRADILQAKLRPGAKLVLRDLRASYTVGLIPLREALFQLAGDGLVVSESQRGFRVAPVSLAEFADIAGVRRVVEALAFAQSIDRSSCYWRAHVQSALDRFTRVGQKVGDQRPINEEWETFHRQFHFALISECGSPTLLRFCSQIFDRFDRYRRLAVPSRGYMAGTADDHGELAALALVGNRQHAIELLVRHIDEISTVVTANFAT